MSAILPGEVWSFAQGMVKYIVRSYMNDLDGVICPSEIVYDLLKIQGQGRKTYYSDWD